MILKIFNSLLLRYLKSYLETDSYEMLTVLISAYFEETRQCHHARFS
jgi:hypothetical protein